MSGHLSPARRRPREPLPALAPLGWLYLRLARIHHATFDRGWRTSQRVEAPVVSIGNVTAGGTGKTPAVSWLARCLASRGRAVGIVSRGYGGQRARDPLLVAQDGALHARAAEAGDEPVMLARETPARVVTVGRDRVAAARLAVRSGADVLLLDDGFQHRRLHRDLDLVLVDAANPWGSGLGLPAGLLREPARSVLRADLVLLSRCAPPLIAESGPLPAESVPEPLRRILDRAAPASTPPVFATRHEPCDLMRPDGARESVDSLRGRRILAVSGIARPDDFGAALTGAGATMVDHLAWPDHHRYDGEDAQVIERRARSLRAELIVTTSKDAVRWPQGAPPPHVLRLRLRVPAEREIVDRVMRAIERSGKTP